jgi:hypothetical protein
MKHPRPSKLEHAAWLLRTLHETPASKERVIAAYPIGFYDTSRTVDLGARVDWWLEQLGEADAGPSIGVHVAIDEHTTLRSVASTDWIDAPRGVDADVFEKHIVGGITVVTFISPTASERKTFLQRARDYAQKGCGAPIFASFDLASIDSGAAMIIVPAASFTLSGLAEALERATHDPLVRPLVDLDAFRHGVYEAATATARQVHAAAAKCSSVHLPIPLDAVIFIPKLELDENDAFIAHGYGLHSASPTVERGVPYLIPCGDHSVVAAGESDAAYSLTMRALLACVAHAAPETGDVFNARLAGRDAAGKRMLSGDELVEDHDMLRLRPIDLDSSAKLARVRTPASLDELIGIIVERAGFPSVARESLDAQDEYLLRNELS